MTQLGSFTATKAGYSGRIHTMSLDAAVSLVPAEPSDSENAPDYRVLLGESDHGPEIGAGWKRTGEKAGAFVAVQIDDPAFIQPLRANLFRHGDDGHVLVWNRPTKRDEKA
ncbi:MAG: DUF736 domain-containing protein [Pseudomonadota bacterium]